MMMKDKQLNDYVDYLLGWSTQERLDSNGSWAKSIDIAMALWEERYPGTRPPAYAKLGQPPACFSGVIPPIYEGKLE